MSVRPFRFPLQLLLCLGGMFLAPSLLAQALPGWELVWSDEFTQADGTAPDSSKWGYDIGRGSNGWGNQELQYYTSRTENARIENNELVIEVRQESNYANSGANYTSARLLTENKFDHQYGRFEARVKVPSGSGIWPAFWMLGNDFRTAGWPFCGEIDIMEFVGRKPQEIFGTIHGPGYAGGESYSGIYDFGTAVPDDYHVYAVEWEEDLIRWYVDGILYHTAKPSDIAPDPWVFDHAFFMILNVAVGGNFGGTLDPNLTFPRRMQVDYVRVYTPAGDGNKLRNSGLENGNLNDWTPFSPGGANDPGAFVESTDSTYYNGGNGGGDPVLTHSGTYVAKVFGDFSGAENFNGMYQEVTVEPGSLWNAGGFALTHPQDLMTGTNTAWMEVTFRDNADNILSLYRSEVLDSGSVSPGNWMTLSVNQKLNPNDFSLEATNSELEAPPGATKARVQVVLRQGDNFDGGSMYFDDLSFREVIVTDFDPAFELGTVVTWAREDVSSRYQVQESENAIDWIDSGDPIEGTNPGTFFTTSPSMHYRVIESTLSSTGNGISNPGFELSGPAEHPGTGALDWSMAGAEDTDPSNGSVSISAASSSEAFSPRSGSRMLVIESSTPPAPASVIAPYSDLRSTFIPVKENAAYELKFFAAHVEKTGGANPQTNIRYFDSASNFLGESGFQSFSSLGSDWTEVTHPFTTISGTAFVEVSWIQALGAGNGWKWVTLIDDVELLTDSLPGSDNVVTATVADGYRISWNTTLGRTYQVTSGDDLIDFSTVDGDYAGTGLRMQHAGPIDGDRRFYRIKETE